VCVVLVSFLISPTGLRRQLIYSYTLQQTLSVWRGGGLNCQCQETGSTSSRTYAVH